ncbi:MAG: MotA/TolQ/ExbB proton channel family protein [Candidatus Competibacteraceae bacterium]
MSLLARIPPDGPRPLITHILAIIFTLILWKLFVVYLLIAPADHITPKWIASLSGNTVQDVIATVGKTQSMIWGHFLNKVSLIIGTWAVAFSLTRVMLALVWKIRLHKALDSYKQYTAGMAISYSYELLNSWLKSRKHVQEPFGVLRDLYEELASGTLDPSGHLEDRTQMITEQCQRLSVLVRVAVWAIPIIGFVGTVVGISEAITRFEELVPQESSSSIAQFLPRFQVTMKQIMGDLGIAFHTTLAALLIVLPVAFLVEGANTFEEGTYTTERTRFFQHIWLDIAPVWRRDAAGLSGGESRVDTTGLSAEIRNLAAQLQILSGRISATHGIISDLGIQVERLQRLLEALEIEEMQGENNMERR